MKLVISINTNKGDNNLKIVASKEGGEKKEFIFKKEEFFFEDLGEFSHEAADYGFNKINITSF